MVDFVNLMHIGPDQIYNYDHDFVLLEFYTGIPRFTLLIWGHIYNRGERKPRELRLLSSNKGEENRIEL